MKVLKDKNDSVLLTKIPRHVFLTLAAADSTLLTETNQIIKCVKMKLISDVCYCPT
jgi:hypothetical protein